MRYIWEVLKRSQKDISLSCIWNALKNATGACLKWFSDLIIPFYNLPDFPLLMLRQTFLCFINTFLLLKHFNQFLQKYLLFLFFVFQNINLSKSLIYTQCDLFSFITSNKPMKLSNIYLKCRLEKSAYFHNKTH